jgi:opacity protein-like surface antigen
MKTMTSIASSLAVLFAFSLTGAAHAVGTTPKPFSPMAPMSSSGNKADNYIGGSIGKASANDFCATLQNCSSEDQSWKLFAGVRMNDNIVLEGGYVDFGKQQGQDSNGAVTQKATAITAAGLATFPMNEQIELFGKAGMARWDAEYNDSTGNTASKGTDVLVGAGANYDLGDNMGVRAEWERFKDIGDSAHKGDVDLLSVGVTFSSL